MPSNVHRSIISREYLLDFIKYHLHKSLPNRLLESNHHVRFEPLPIFKLLIQKDAYNTIKYNKKPN